MMSSELEDGPDARPGWAPRLRPLGTVVHQRVTTLHRQISTAGATATLARLRHAAARPPGSDPAVWAITIEGIPGTPAGDDPTPEEWAAHAALTLYALHQQSRSEPMHVRGRGLGHAIRQLDGVAADGPARRRLDATVTASSFREAAHHLRGLVSQLRSAGIPLDYGQLADDLHQFQSPRSANAVRRRWGRQFYRLQEQEHTTTSPDQHQRRQGPGHQATVPSVEENS